MTHVNGVSEMAQLNKSPKIGYNIYMNNVKGFELIADTRPVRISAWGKTINELFANSLRGMATLMQPTIFTARNSARKATQLLRVEAVDLNTLLIEFLSKVIGLSDIHNLVFTNVTFKNIGDNFLEAELSGIAADALEHEVKGVSYQEVDITRNQQSGLYETTLEFDV